MRCHLEGKAAARVAATYNRGAHEAFEFHAPRIIAARNDSADSRERARGMVAALRRHRAAFEAWKITRSGDAEARPNADT